MVMVEVGVVRAHPLKIMYLMCKSVFKTWMYAREQGHPANEWFGVYEAGSEIMIAQFGCSPFAKGSAYRLADAENKWRSSQS